jgi:hypothetical protein
MKASGADFKIVEIDLKNKPEWYQPKINPASKVREPSAHASLSDILYL